MFGRRAENILVIKTDGLAGFVAAEPIFEAIRAANVGARISLLTTNDLQRIARASPYFDQVAVMPSVREPEARKAFTRQLKAAKFSKVYDLAADDWAKKLQAAFGPFGPKWHAVAPSPKRRRATGDGGGVYGRSGEKLHASAGNDAPERLPDFSWALAARKDSANMQPSWFGISGPFGLLMPALDAGSRWPAESYAAFARLLSSRSIMPVMVGGKDIHGFGDEVSHHAPEILDLSGKTDHLQLAALSQEASFFVSDFADEVHLALSAGCAGVLIKKSGQETTSPTGRHVVTLTVEHELGEASPEFVWRTLENMGLLPAADYGRRATAR